MRFLSALTRPRLFATTAVLLASTQLLSCAQQPIVQPLRSLEASGQLALICLSAPGVTPGLPTDQCYAGTADISDYSVPHLYALITQRVRGEIAIVDLVGQSVVDVDPGTPGFNFLPVGAQPVDIVATPEGVASFVAVEEQGRTGIYGLPSSEIFTHGKALKDWPACSLPSRPGDMELVVVSNDDLTKDDTACPGDNFAVDTLNDEGDPDHPHGDLSVERTKPGARKLIVSLPDEGDLLVIDAQRLLDRKAGSFDTCPVERRIKLKIDLPASNPLPTVPTGDICPAPPPVPQVDTCPQIPPKEITYQTDFTPTPARLVRHDNTLFISDKGAPVIHRIDISNACEPVEQSPLLPSSYDDPKRPVFTSAIAVSPITHVSKEQWLYAVDDNDGSVMAFDVSPPNNNSTEKKSRSPRMRERPDLFPFQSRDRLALGAPVRDLIFVQRDVPVLGADGNRQTGILCDPDPTQPDPGLYRTSADYSAGAAPQRFRGTFAIAILTNGQLVVVDVEDLDAPCRSYRELSAPLTNLPSWVTGCEACNSVETTTFDDPNDNDKKARSGIFHNAGLLTTGESSCQVVNPHEIRAGSYIANNTNTGPHSPNFLAFPLLTLEGDSLKTDTSEDGVKNPKMLGPAPSDDGKTPKNAGVWNLDRGGTPSEMSAAPETAENAFLITDLREPRVHLIDQNWVAIYEGVIPGFNGQVARFNVEEKTPAQRGAFDTNGVFCDRGVHDMTAARLDGARLLDIRPDTSDPNSQAVLDAFASQHADALVITNELLDPADPYWNDPVGDCSYVRCRATFGTTENPTLAREFPIRTAYQDAVLVDETDILDITDPEHENKLTVECCFSPMLLSYEVRARNTWITQGSFSGFQHRVVGIPEQTERGTAYRCIDAGVDPASGSLCDPILAVRTGRVFEVPRGQGPRSTGLTLDNPYLFRNSMFMFGIFAGEAPSERDMTYSWTMSGSFIAYAISLGRGSSLIAPQSLSQLPTTNELIIPDGSLQGVVLVDTTTMSVSRSFF